MQLSGVAVDLPPGWEAEIYPGEVIADPVPRAAGPAPIVLHAASFPLPKDRGDFGSGAVEAMQPGDVLVILFEYAGGAGAALFRREGMPLPLLPEHFSPRTLTRSMPGRVGAQRFFTEAGRAFCLHVVLAAPGGDPDLVAIANEIASSITIDP